MIVDALNLSHAEVYGVVSSYQDFRREPSVRHVLKLCRAEACQAMGGEQLAAAAQLRLGVDCGETTSDGAVTIDPVFWLGLCATAPAAMIDAEQRGIRDGDWVKLKSRSGETALHAKLSERVAPDVVYTTLRRPGTQANVITTDFPDWATKCREYKVTAVQVSTSNGLTQWQRAYQAMADHSRRIAVAADAAE